MTAPCVIRPPTSVTNPAAVRNSGVAVHRARALPLTARLRPQLAISCRPIDQRNSAGPTTGDLQIRLVHEPLGARCVPGRAGGVDEPGREGLHPSVHGHVIDVDAALSQQLFDIAVGQAIAQIPSHRDRDDLARKPVPGRSHNTALELVIPRVSNPR
jgi:hypothetical protein